MSAPARRLLALLLLGPFFAASSCTGPPPEPPPRYEDLVTSGLLARSEGASPAGEVFCADETRFGATLEPGAEARMSSLVGASPRLLVSACAPAADGPAEGAAADPGEAWLTVTVEGARGLSSEMRLDLSTGIWRERTLDLAAHGEGPVRLRLRAGPRPVLVADLALRHRSWEGSARGQGSPGLGRSERSTDRWTPPWRGRRRPPRRILLISIDTLRADAVGALSGTTEGSPTPHLDAFAARAEIWAPHHAAASWTKPSHASLLTGVPPAVHGAISIEEEITPAVDTLAERFRAAGLATAALVYDCAWLAPDFGFAQGFDVYGVVPWRAGQAVRAASNWMAEHREEEFFYFLHLFTPHSDARVLPYEGEGASRRSVEARWGLDDYGCRGGRCASALLKALNDGLEPLPEEPEVLRHLYLRGVADVDRALGVLFRNLEEAGLWEGLTIVVTSDHGEAFFEHGQVLHTTLYQEVLEVPLIIKRAGEERPGSRWRTPSSALDVAPTLLAAAGLSADGLPGTRLDRRRAETPIFAGTFDRAVVTGGWKLMVPLRGEPVELYDLTADPHERRNLAADPRHAERLERLRAIHEARIEAEGRRRTALGPHAGEGAGERLTPDERRRLEALGYLD